MLCEQPKPSATRKRVVLWTSCWFDGEGVYRELVWTLKTDAYVWMCQMLRQKRCAWIARTETEHWYVEDA